MIDRSSKRDRKGRFVPGRSGNLRGRPPRRDPENSPEELRRQFFAVANSLVAVTEGGKSKKITRSEAINKRLAQMAINGDRASVLAWSKLEARYAAEEIDHQSEMIDLIQKGEKTIRDFPEGVTDRYIELVKALKSRLKLY